MGKGQLSLSTATQTFTYLELKTQHPGHEVSGHHPEGITLETNSLMGTVFIQASLQSPETVDYLNNNSDSGVGEGRMNWVGLRTSGRLPGVKSLPRTLGAACVGMPQQYQHG